MKIKTTQDGENCTEVSSSRSTRIKTLKDLLAAARVNRQQWRVESWTANAWENASKDAYGDVAITTLHQVKARLIRRTLTQVFPPIAPVQVSPTYSTIRKPRRARRSEVPCTLILPDPQIGFARDNDTGALTPLHCPRALDLAVQAVYHLRPASIVLLGDLLDLAEWSNKFLVSPEFVFTTQPSLVAASWWLGLLRAAAPRAQIVLLEGNHDKRLGTAVLSNLKAAYDLRPANELGKPPVLSLPRLLDLEGLGIIYKPDYPNGRYWITDSLQAIHGDIARNVSGKTAAAVVANAEESVVFGHTHRLESAARTVHGRDGIKVIGAYSCGCLCRVDGVVPGVRARQNWQQGLAVAYHGELGSQVSLVSILGGEMIIGRRLFRGEDRTAVMQESTNYKFIYSPP